MGHIRSAFTMLTILILARSIVAAQCPGDQDPPCQCIGTPGQELVDSCHDTGICPNFGFCNPVDTNIPPNGINDSCRCGPPTFASGISTTVTPSTSPQGACYSTDLSALIQKCIQDNQTNPPPGNPGPFTTGYKSIVVLAAECYSGGFLGITNIGPNVVVGASAAETKKAGAIDGRMEWLEQVMTAIKQDRTTPIVTLIARANGRNRDKGAMAPPAAASQGGNNVILGDPNNNLQPGMSFHAVLFAGVYRAGTPDGDAVSASLTRMRDETLKQVLHVPAANIDMKLGGTYVDLGMMIKAAWQKMNDNEQLILVIGDHGTRCFLRRKGQFQVVPTVGIRTGFQTPDYMVDVDVVQPRVAIDTVFLNQPSPVRLNGDQIGVLPASAQPAHQEFVFSPALLASVGENNELVIETTNGLDAFDSIALTTGPVWGLSLSIPTLSEWSVIALVVLLLTGAAILLSRRIEDQRPNGRGKAG